MLAHADIDAPASLPDVDAPTRQWNLVSNSFTTAQPKCVPFYQHITFVVHTHCQAADLQHSLWTFPPREGVCTLFLDCCTEVQRTASLTQQFVFGGSRNSPEEIMAAPRVRPLEKCMSQFLCHYCPVSFSYFAPQKQKNQELKSSVNFLIIVLAYHGLASLLGSLPAAFRANKVKVHHFQSDSCSTTFFVWPWNAQHNPLFLTLVRP